MGIVDLSVKRRVTISMVTVAILLFGVVSFSRLSVNLLPELSYPSLTIRTEFEGAAPTDIENLITKPIEEAVGVVKGVKQIQSSSKAGQSDVLLEFNWGTSMDVANLEVIGRLDGIQLPLEAERPVTLRFDPSLDPIMRYALYLQEDSSTSVKNPVDELLQLRVWADELVKKSLESAAGVASVKVSGGLEEQIQILIDQEKLAYLSIPISQIIQILRAENINLSGGTLEEGTQQYLVRTVSEFQNLDQIRDVVVAIQGNSVVYLRDVAEVIEGYKERESINRLNGKEAVEIAIYKEGDANTVVVADAVNARIAEVQNNWPSNLELEEVYDQSTFIASAVNEVKNAGIIGGILAVLVLYLFLRNIWITLIISISIPVSVIATFNLMYGNNVSLNIMSLGGIALGIGMLVDNSIVVLENIARHRDMGKGVLVAARDGAKEVSTAVVASTLTTIAVFFPLVFVDGIAGQLFRDQALTVTFSLLASLAAAITLIPMLASIDTQKSDDDHRVLPELEAPKTSIGRIFRSIRIFLWYRLPLSIIRFIRILFKGISKVLSWIFYPVLTGFDAVYSRVETMYESILAFALRAKSLVLLIAASTLFGTYYVASQIGVELIPQMSQGEYVVNLSMPTGTPIEETDRVIRNVQNYFDSDAQVRSTFAVAGTGNKMDASTDQGGDQVGEISVRLMEGTTSTREEESIEKARVYLAKVPGLRYEITKPTLFSFSTPIEVEVRGFNLADLKKVSDQLTQKMLESEQFADVRNSMEVGNPEIQIQFDRAKAASYGLQVNEIADRIVDLVRGEVATQYSYQDRKIDILVRSEENDRLSVEDIGGLFVNPEAERPIPLNAVATLESSVGPSEIRRSSQQRVAVISANIRKGDLSSAARVVNEMIRATPMPTGIYAELAGQNEELGDSFQSLLFALALAVFLVYLVMASQFESLLHPFIILFTIPLALVGAVLALYLSNSTLSVVVFIGAILLAGIVVNNAIVLIDLVNQLRYQGMSKMDAIQEGAKSRLRPILMTTLTTTLGLLPLALGFGDGAELRAPMGITVIGGLLFSTLLTLVVIPVMYAIMDRKNYEVIEI